ncbi:STAS domain-containing protein [Streptomyces spinosirectus]
MTPDADDHACEPPAANPYARTRVVGGFVVVEVVGEIDLATAEFILEHLDAATGRPCPDVLVDLRGVEFIDCSGLRVLCRGETRAREHGGRLRLVSDGPHVLRLLRGAGLLKRLPPLPALPGEGRT